jgi:hypothetical protein
VPYDCARRLPLSKNVHSLRAGREDLIGTFTHEPHSCGLKCGLRIFAHMIKTFHIQLTKNDIRLIVPAAIRTLRVETAGRNEKCGRNRPAR